MNSSSAAEADFGGDASLLWWRVACGRWREGMCPSFATSGGGVANPFPFQNDAWRSSKPDRIEGMFRMQEL